MDELRKALAAFNALVDRREVFRADNYDDEVGEPSCGYRKWDESMTDYALDIAEAGEHLADTVTKFLGEQP